MRNAFFDTLYQIASLDKNVILLTSDTGALVLDEFRKTLPNQCINVGIAEQNMISVASGLAMSGKNVYVYAIVPFATMRCFEQIRVDICCQNLGVKVIGVGVGLDYSTLGPTHHGLEDVALMRSLPGMTIFTPSDDIQAQKFCRISYESKGPVYIRLDRVGSPLIYSDIKDNFSGGLHAFGKGKDLCIIACGRMVLRALKVAERLRKRAVDVVVIDLYRIKPLDEEALFKAIEGSGHIATLEEHSVVAGMGSAVSELLTEKGKSSKFKRLGLPDRACRQYGSREYLHSLVDLGEDKIFDTLIDWMRG